MSLTRREIIGSAVIAPLSAAISGAAMNQALVDLSDVSDAELLAAIEEDLTAEKVRHDASIDYVSHGVEYRRFDRSGKAHWTLMVASPSERSVENIYEANGVTVGTFFTADTRKEANTQLLKILDLMLLMFENRPAQHASLKVLRAIIYDDPEV